MAGPNDAIDYETAKALARADDVTTRRGLARRADLAPEILFYLAEDGDSGVRQAIAANAAAPIHADLRLARDPDAEVRGAVGAKLGRVLPDVAEDTRSKIYARTVDVLETVARDAESYVRQVLAEAVRDRPEVPRHVARELAEDRAEGVCSPILESSPVLGERDLLAVIAATRVPEALAAIAGRDDLPAAVADAVVDSGDERAIARLLDNESAYLRETTLERVVAHAPAHEPWHAPLVRRPGLPGHLAQRLARFVAAALVRELQARSDLDPATTNAIAQTLTQRLEDGEVGAVDPGWQASARDSASSGGAEPAWAVAEETGGADTTVAEVRALASEGRLDEEAVASRLANGDQAFATAALAELADVEKDVVEQILSAHSPRAVCALVWRAGLSAQLALQVQLGMGGIPPTRALRPKNGGFPMSQSDMVWQLEFFGVATA